MDLRDTDLFATFIMDELNVQTIQEIKSACHAFTMNGDFVKYKNLYQGVLTENSLYSPGIQLADYNVELSVPLIEEQEKLRPPIKKIVKRIALKNKINENLEEKSYQIYKKYVSWENLKCGKISELADIIVCRKTPSTKKEHDFEENIPVVTIPDMHDNVFAIHIGKFILKNVATCLIPKNSVCVSCMASAGLVVLTDSISQTNQQINMIVCKKSVSTYYVYFQMKELSEYIRQIGSCGSTTCNLSKSGFSNIEILIPDEEIQKENFHF